MRITILLKLIWVNECQWSLFIHQLVINFVFLDPLNAASFEYLIMES